MLGIYIGLFRAITINYTYRFQPSRYFNITNEWSVNSSDLSNSLVPGQVSRAFILGGN